MMTTFRSKIDCLIGVLLIGGSVWVIPLEICLALEKGTVLQWVLSVFWTIFIICIYDVALNIRYVVDNDSVTVRCGRFVKQTYRIAEIVSIQRSNTIMSSPAASLDRIELITRKRQSIVISPYRRDEFIAALLAVNPAIEVAL